MQFPIKSATLKEHISSSVPAAGRGGRTRMREEDTMKQLLRKTIPLLLAVSMLLSLAVPAGAAFEDMSDVKGHWAQDTLRQAYEDGILKGVSDTAMAPNSSVTVAQAVTILCRVLHVTGMGDTSAFDIPADAWYAQDVAKGVYAGLLDESAAGKLEDPISRGDSFLMFAQAFQLVPAQPDLSVLEQFSDTEFLDAAVAKTAAALVEQGIVNGIGDQLKLDQPLTRAEFATILYRVADQHTTADAYTGHTGTGSVLSGAADLTGVTAGDLWFDQSAQSIHLTDVTADAVTICADNLTSLALAGTGSIGRLVLGAKNGDVTLSLPETYALDTLVVGQGTGDVSFAGKAKGMEITGSNRTITVNSSLERLVISGSGNTISLARGCSMEQITVLGTDNVLTLNGTAKDILLAGRDNTVKGSGRADQVRLNTRYYTLTVSKGKLERWTGYDIKNVTVDLKAPKDLAAGETLQATARLTVPEEDLGKRCVGLWYLNGELMEQTDLILGKEDPVSHFVPNYTHDLNLDATVKFVLQYTNNDGDVFTQEDSAPVELETFDDLGLADAEIQVTLPETLAAGAALNATAVVDTPEKGQVCTGYWYVDGKEVASGSFTLGSGQTAKLTHQYDYYYGMPETSTVSYRLTYTTQDGRQQEVSGQAQVKLENFPDNGIAHASASLRAPSPLAAGKTLEVTADLTYLEAGKYCTASWYVDGKAVSTQTILLGTDIPKLSHKYTYTEDMKLTSEIQFVLTYTTEDGRQQKVTASKTIQLENYDYLYYHGLTAEDVLKTVTSGYIGNYTLAWAQSHDYKPEIKTAWVNLKGYQSNTKYLVWVNLTYQRVNIFEGSQGKWKLIRTCLCGSGTNATPTIRGVFTTSYKQTAWDYGSYYCGPIVRFYGTSGYAFHSRLQYWPMNSDRYYDARIGFPISHGCLRMYNDDIWWMYNNIPNGTTVVVY